MESKMPNHSRVWIYQSNRFMSPSEVLHINKVCQMFIDQWQAHGQSLVSEVHVLKERFVVFFVDEQQAQATGCSIDKSVHLMQGLGNELNVDFFDRMQMLYFEDGEITESRMHDFWAMRKAENVTDETLVFNNLVKDKGEFMSSWIVPFGKSWHSEMW
ncbi:MAG: ABC transporter ATPase [Bacteroidota bacterium]